MFAVKKYHEHQKRKDKGVRNRYLYITLLAVLGWNAEMLAQQTENSRLPRLVVNITIDQLRSDYLESFAPLYSADGFKKLMVEGVVFEQASYPFINPDRASAAATVITGTTPFYHGIVGRQWMDRNSLRPVWCTEDLLKPGIPSPASLSVSTIGDELKVSSEGKAQLFAIAPWQETAIMTAGHAADGVCWRDERTGQWVSSQYYSNETPNFILSFNSLKQPTNKKNPSENSQINSDITALALQSVTHLSMGLDLTTDLLCVTYDAGQDASKEVTDWQQEVERTYLQLDRELGKLITRLERRLGAGEILFVLTSTGSGESRQTDYAKYRIPTGTFYINRAANLLNMYFSALWGQGRYIETCYDNQLFVNHKLLETKRLNLTEFFQRAQEFVSQMEGVKRVYTSLQLQNDHSEELRRHRNSYAPQISGDIIVEVTPGWHIQHEETGSDRLSQLSAFSFPIIFYGHGVKAEKVKTPVTTDRIAPTIAKAIRIRAPNACSSEPLF